MALQVWLPLLGDLNNNGVNNATITNNGATVDNNGKLGKCYKTNGSSSYITGTYTATENMSFCIWVKFNSSFAGHLIDARVSDVGYQPMYVESGRVQSGGSTGGFPNFSYSFTTGTWYHLCIVYTPNDVSLYVNGSCVGTSTGGKGYDYGAKEFTLCCRHSHNNYFIPADIQDFRIYDHSLSAKEVKEISKGMILHYPMTGGGRGCANLVADSYVNTTSSAYGFGVKSVNIIEGKTYTVSARGYISDAAVTSGTKLVVYFYKSDWTYCPAILQIATTSPSTKFATFTATQTTTLRITSYSFKSQGKAGDPVTCIWYKVEEGNKPTPWMPHASDSTYTSMGYNDNIEYDVSGYLHNGAINGSVSYSSDSARYNVSTEFSKAGYINVPSFNIDTSAFTLNFWVKMKTATSQHFVLGTFNSWTGNGIGVYRDANAAWYSCLIRSAGESTYKSFLLYPTVGSWHMLTLTYDGTNYKGYLNGILKQNATYGSGGVVSNPVFMVGNSKFNGTPASENEEAFVSDVRFYATALSAEDIQKLYNTAVSISNNGTLLGYELVEQ